MNTYEELCHTAEKRKALETEIDARRLKKEG